MTRPLTLCDLDFTDLQADDDKDDSLPRGLGSSVPPPPPPCMGMAVPPPMIKAPNCLNLVPPPNFRQMNGSSKQTTAQTTNGNVIKKSKKTVSVSNAFCLRKKKCLKRVLNSI